MAIVEMKKMHLLALKKDGAKILRRLQRMACVQVIESDSEDMCAFASTPSPRLEEVQKTIVRLEWAIKKIQAFDTEKAGMFALKPVLTEEEANNVMDMQPQTMALVERLEEIERGMGELRSREAREHAQIDQLTPWKDMTASLEELGTTRRVHTELLSVPMKNLEQMRTAAAEFATKPVLEQVGGDRENAFLFAAVYLPEKAAYDKMLKDVGASTVQFAGLKGSPAELIRQSEANIAGIAKEREALNRETEQFGARTKEVKLLRDVLELELQRENASTKFAATESAFLMTAWIPADREQKIRDAVSKITKDFDIAFDAPREDENPPIAMRNNKVISPFESIVKMYSMPDYRGIDPTAVMMPFFICYFGLMVSDAAYGIILAILAGFLAKKLKCKGTIGSIAFVGCLGGLATLFWGAMLGGWFGIEDVPAIIGFTPMSEPLKMMILCLALGAVQILAGMGVAMYMSFKRHRPWDALFDQGFWLIVFAGIGMLFVNSTVGMILMIGGAVGIVLTGGRHKKGFGKITSGLGKLYDITGFMSDILSYARLFGMGLATGVIAMVMNNVAMMLWGGIGTIGSIVILLVGHSFNIAINALGAYVHACRLQYIEFFGKFYEDGGTAFMPMDTTGKYVEFESDNSDNAA